MFVAKVKRVVNPHGKKRTVKKAKTKRMANGRFVSAKRKKKNSKRKVSRSNPAQLLTLGFNPHRPKKRRNMATKKAKRKSPKRVAAAKKAARTRKRHLMAKVNPVQHTQRKRYSRQKKNSTRIVVMAPRRRSNGRRHNPSIGNIDFTGMGAVKMVAGGLVGVTATKMIVPQLPASIISNPLGAAVATIAVALAGGWAIAKYVPGAKEFGGGFAFGGLMQGVSVLINQFAIPGTTQFALAGAGRRGGVGDFVPGSFAVPQNPVLLTGTSSQGGAAGRPPVNRAYPRPY